jgi:pyruvate,orthophosphate dikinase
MLRARTLWLAFARLNRSRKCRNGIDAVYKQLLEYQEILWKQHYRDMQDIEFTIERGELFMLQTRNGKRTGAAAVKVACDMVQEKLIDEKEAVLRIPANDLTQLLLPSFEPESHRLQGGCADASALPASPGAAVGKLAFTADEAVERAAAGERRALGAERDEPGRRGWNAQAPSVF